ncbi:Uncharacterised protein [Mycobacteroides abscessus subsp. abscessus]|nr:Uncharacterised protein [Mycobacteroides abscessus subsp. abscessus]
MFIAGTGRSHQGNGRRSVARSGTKNTATTAHTMSSRSTFAGQYHASCWLSSPIRKVR